MDNDGSDGVIDLKKLDQEIKEEIRKYRDKKFTNANEEILRSLQVPELLTLKYLQTIRYAEFGEYYNE